MPITRRGFLKIAGSTAVILAAGTGAFIATREPSAALVPWKTAGATNTDIRHRALSWAILAPNPHNRQPWVVDLATDGEAILYCDPERRLPETDPFDRQVTIGLGCFLEVLRQAAAEDGYRAEITTFPQGEPEPRLDNRPIARIRFVRDAGVRKDPLFANVLARRSNKEPFDTTRTVDQGIVASLTTAAAAPGRGSAGTVDAGQVGQMRKLTWDAFETEIRTPRTYLESVRLMRIGKAEIESQPDGIDLGGPFLEALKLAGVLNRKSLADPTSDAFQQGIDMYRDITGTAMGYFWIVSDGNARAQQLDAGRAYVRANLEATRLGISMHPLSQALQEYEEMAAHYKALYALLGIETPARLQMFARLGYGPEIAPSPRWPYQEKIKPA